MGQAVLPGTCTGWRLHFRVGREFFADPSGCRSRGRGPVGSRNPTIIPRICPCRRASSSEVLRPGSGGLGRHIDHGWDFWILGPCSSHALAELLQVRVQEVLVRSLKAIAARPLYMEAFGQPAGSTRPLAHVSTRKCAYLLGPGSSEAAGRSQSPRSGCRRGNSPLTSGCRHGSFPIHMISAPWAAEIEPFPQVFAHIVRTRAGAVSVGGARVWELATLAPASCAGAGATRREIAEGERQR